MKREILPLTGLRGVAASLVVLYHFLEHDADYGPGAPWLVRHGYLAVDMFFVLSGFVMALSYAEIFRHGVAWAAYRDFLIRRLARIYPLYFLITILFAGKIFLNMRGQGPGMVYPGDALASLAMVQAWGFGFVSVAGATWSLSTEFFAYLVFPGLVFWAIFARPAWAVFLCGLAVLAMLGVAKSGLGVAGQLDVVAPDSFLPLLRCLAGFCLGLVMFRVASCDAGGRLFASSGFLLAMLGVLLGAAYLRLQDVFLFATFPAIVLALAFDSAAARMLFGNRLVVHVGVISYSLYLAHPLLVPVKIRLEPLLARIFPALAHPAALAVGLLLTWACAWALYRFVEQPGRRYVQKRLLPTTWGR